MSGTRRGGIKTARVNKLKYGEMFYVTIGRAGGLKSRGGGFPNAEAAREAGKKGGKNSWKYRNLKKQLEDK